MGSRLPRLRVPTFLLPPPSLIVRARSSSRPASGLGHVWATVRVAADGLCRRRSRFRSRSRSRLPHRALLSRTLYPMIVVVHSMPIVAVAPIIVVTLGASDLPRVVITFLIAFFPDRRHHDHRAAGDT